MRAEQELAKFMDRSFYSKLPKKDGSPICFQRCNSYEMQLKGVDVCIDIGGEKYKIDEKASLYYSNIMIPTFAFEVDSIQKNSKKPVLGWFLNENLETEYYMLIWPNVKCNQKNGWKRKAIRELKADDFTIVEAMLIKKERILDYLKRFGWDKEKILRKAEKLREEKASGKYAIPGTSDFYFYASDKIAEYPVNIVINKKILRCLAAQSYFISSENCAIIPKR